MYNQFKLELDQINLLLIDHAKGNIEIGLHELFELHTERDQLKDILIHLLERRAA